MLIKTRGLVLKQRNIGENDRILTVLTQDRGVIEMSARGVKRMKSRLSGATQTLCYSEFCLYEGKNYFSVNSAETLYSFYDLRLDVVKLSLAAYFCDIAAFISPPAETGKGFLRFLLNTLSLLEKDKRQPALLKGIFELRVMALSGFMPDLVCCSGCGCYESEKMYFLPIEGLLYCDSCAEKELSSDIIKYTVPAAVLYAMRHVIYSEDERVFAFKLTGKSLEQFGFITENYLLIHTEGKFKSLDIYRRMIVPAEQLTHEIHTDETEQL